MSDFLLALSFLTRLVPGRTADEAALGRTLLWFPAVGLVLGLALVPLAGLAPTPWLQAWALTAATLWATRGLHHDGAADLGDAWGASAEGERFWLILKDSRIGAFGVMSLWLCLSGQLILAEELYARRAWGALVFAPCAGRTAAVLLAWLARDLARPGLGGSFLRGAEPGRVVLAGLAAGALGLLLAPAALPLTILLLAPGLVFLRRLGRRQGGLNGDFLGAAIVYGELCAGAAALLT